MQTHLLESTIYKKPRSDLTVKIWRNTNLVIMKTSIAPNIKTIIRKIKALTSKLSRLPKINKENIPLRPIVNSIDSPTYDIAKYLTQPFIGQTESFITDRAHFVKEIINIKVGKDDFPVFSILSS